MDIEAIRAFYLGELSALTARQPEKAARGARNLVIGLATNLGKAGMEIFVNSLRRSGYADDVVLFVSALDPQTEAFCRERAVTLVRACNLMYSPLHPTFLRFSLYYDFLASRLANGERYDKVFLTDVSDVVFQDNPFRSFTPDRLTVFFESGVTIGECPANRSWIRRAFGEAELAKLQDKPISCSGTTMGPMREVMEYLLKMQLGATNADPRTLTSHGVDQGVHNYIVHNAWLRDVCRSTNGEVVLTLHYHLAQNRAIFVIPDGRICDDDARIIPIVHQYNRSPDLMEQYRQLYAS